MSKEPEYHASLLVGAEPWAIEQVKEDRERLEAEVARLTAQLSLDCDRANALGTRAEKAEREVARLREALTKVRAAITKLEANKNMEALTGTYWLTNNGKITQITEAEAKTLISANYNDGQHKDFPQWDGATVSLKANQSIRFDEARIARVALAGEGSKRNEN